MNKLGTDTKVKKSLVRNYEQKVRHSSRNQVIYDVACSSKELEKTEQSSQKENELSQPSLCSSEALANYLSDVKNSLPAPLTIEDINVEKGEIASKLTKKLNFHINDRIYKNLIELNANVSDLKTKKNKRSTSAMNQVKRDLEPNIEDFYQDEEEIDLPPSIPIIKPKFKPVKKIDDGHLHRLMAAFETL
ncbi:uncharacterized protein LOC113516150 [Galleria mellonella]|uniref:Uncharacterized protein LOC113516150 n=1 Tax=Galleria mellonella TaxID=7137 RepID=A0A6J3BW98_GALME|nr:uncharacterized protein LOC113516150 [Galleria mellonella]